MNNIENILNDFAFERPEVITVFLFGSEASGVTHKESDIDIAVLFRDDKIPSPHQVQDLREELTLHAKREVDLVVFNTASPVIRMQILRKGKKVYESNRKISGKWFVRTLNEYDDLKKNRSVIEKNITRGRTYG